MLPCTIDIQTVARSTTGTTAPTPTPTPPPMTVPTQRQVRFARSFAASDGYDPSALTQRKHMWGCVYVYWYVLLTQNIAYRNRSVALAEFIPYREPTSFRTAAVPYA